ncbi:MAG: hypothetical protein R6V05_14550 [Candidatus Brocadiia bacterium]
MKQSCSNPRCQYEIPTADKQPGEIVECPACGRLNEVGAGPRLSADALDIDTVELVAERGRASHPARLRCTLCNTLLGVRQTTCPNCGADMRTGVAIPKQEEEPENPNLLPILIGGAVLIFLALLVLAGMAMFAPGPGA